MTNPSNETGNCGKVDIHTHILPPEWPSFTEKFGYDGWVSLKHLDQYEPNGHRKSLMVHDNGQVFRPVDSKLYSIEHRLAEMERTGIEKQVISIVPVMFSYWAKAEDTEVVSRHFNDYIAGVSRDYPDKFIGLGSVPMQNTELAIKELIRCRYELDMKGLIIGTHINQLTLDNPEFEPFWKAAQEHSMPLFIHPWDVCKANGRWSQFWLPYIVGMTAETTAAALSLAFSGVLERNRSLKICLSHGGGTLPYLSPRANHGFNVYPNDMQKFVASPPDVYLKRSLNVCTDTLLYHPSAFKLALDYFGEDSLMLGSDYPFLLGEEYPGSVIKQCDNFLSESTKNKLFHSNALRFFQN